MFKSSFTAERKGRCSTLCSAGVTWMDDELMVSMDAVVHGELVLYRTALMQYACHPESNLRGHLALADLTISVLEAGLVLV